MLSFIHYARWAVIERFPDGGGGERLNHTYLLFESNFNGTWDQYIDAFSEVVPFRMKAIWGTSFGFPGPLPVEPFKGYIRRNEFVANHYWSAYPGATTSEIVSAARVEAALEELVAQLGDPGPRRVQRGIRVLPDSGAARPVNDRRQHCGQAYALTVLTPILEGHESALRAT